MNTNRITVWAVIGIGSVLMSAASAFADSASEGDNAGVAKNNR